MGGNGGRVIGLGLTKVREGERSMSVVGVRCSVIRESVPPRMPGLCSTLPVRVCESEARDGDIMECVRGGLRVELCCATCS